MWQPTSRHDWQQALLVTAALMVVGAGALAVAATTADAQADLNVDSLSVAGTNETVNGNVSDVQLSTTLDYETDVPDGERRIIRLKAGPADGSLEMIAYTQVRTDGGQASGTVSLAGSLFEHGQLSAASFQPPVAGSESTELVVEASIEVMRANGESVTESVRDTVVVTLHDDATLSVAVGGQGEVTVESTG